MNITDRPQPYPTFLCIGMQKAGTQWLYEQLGSESSIWMPPIKELCYFSRNFAKHTRRGRLLVTNEERQKDSRLDPAAIEFYERVTSFGPNGAKSDAEYVQLFEPAIGRISGDISPVYSGLSSSAIRDIKRRFPHLKIVLLVRHPVARVLSAVSMHVRKKRFPPDVGQNLQAMHRIVRTASYADRSYPSLVWRRWQRVFGSDARFWLLDDVIADPNRVRTEIAQFLGVPSPVFSVDESQNTKATKAKVEFSDDVKTYLAKKFRWEIARSRREFGGATKAWT